MAVTTPPFLTLPGLSPDRSDRTTFSARSIARDDYIKNVQVPQLVLALANVAANAADAATSAANAQQISISNIYRGALSADPVTRVGGFPNQAGDEYFSTTANLLKRFNGSTWQASDINTANLAASTGSTTIGQRATGTGTVITTVQQKLEEIKSPIDWGLTVSALTPYPYPAGIPVDLLRGNDSDKFALTLAKTLAFTDYPNFKINDRLKNAFLSGSVRVTIVGDSISAGADNWRSNAYPWLLQQKMKQAFPWINFTFSNMAIGGMSAGTLASDSYVGATSLAAYTLGANFWFPKPNAGSNTNTSIAPAGYTLLNEGYWPTASVAGKTWKQHIVDSSPDIIVYAFGMNDGTDIDAFKANYDTFQTFIANALPSAKPWFALVSCFLPSKNPPGGQPHATWQIPAQSMADSLKHFAKRDGYGLIDANAVYTLLREGLRHDYAPYTYEGNWRYGSDSTKWAISAGAPFNPTALRTEGIGLAVRSIQTRDIDFSATFVVNAFDTTNFVGRIMYRCTNSSSGNLSGYTADIIINSTSTNATINVYYKNVNLKSVQFNMGGVPAVGYIALFKVKVYGSRHEIWFYDNLVLDFDDYNSFYAGPVQVGVAQGSGYTQQLGLSYAGVNVETPTHFDKKWLLGTPIYDNTGVFQTFGDFITNPDSMGGNVVNHPTAWGHNTFYGFGIMKFVEELKQRVNQPIDITQTGSAAFTVTAAGGTPQKIVGIASTVVTLRAPAKFVFLINVAYKFTAPTSYPQIGYFLNGNWMASTYIPLNADMGIVSLQFVISLPAGTNTLEIGAVRNTTGETLTIGGPGLSYGTTLTELSNG